MLFQLAVVIACISSSFKFVNASDKNKPHPHTGILAPYDGKHISYKITLEQNKLLDATKPVFSFFLLSFIQCEI
jgi:hypothetical protein